MISFNSLLSFVWLAGCVCGVRGVASLLGVLVSLLVLGALAAWCGGLASIVLLATTLYIFSSYFLLGIISFMVLSNVALHLCNLPVDSKISGRNSRLLASHRG